MRSHEACCFSMMRINVLGALVVTNWSPADLSVTLVVHRLPSTRRAEARGPSGGSTLRVRVRPQERLQSRSPV